MRFRSSWRSRCCLGSRTKFLGNSIQISGSEARRSSRSAVALRRSILTIASDHRRFSGLHWAKDSESSLQLNEIRNLLATGCDMGVCAVMGAEIETDRYPDTGYSMRDTSPEVNAMMFEKLMTLSDEEKIKMGISNAGVREKNDRGGVAGRAFGGAAKPNGLRANVWGAASGGLPGWRGINSQYPTLNFQYPSFCEQENGFCVFCALSGSHC